MANAINWRLLHQQYKKDEKYRSEVRKMFAHYHCSHIFYCISIIFCANLNYFRRTEMNCCKVWNLVNSPEFSREQSGDKFLEDSFLSPESKVSLDYFRKYSTNAKTDVEAFMFMRGKLQVRMRIQIFSRGSGSGSAWEKKSYLNSKWRK